MLYSRPPQFISHFGQPPPMNIQCTRAAAALLLPSLLLFVIIYSDGPFVGWLGQVHGETARLILLT